MQKTSKPLLLDAANDPHMSRFNSGREAARHYLKVLGAYRAARSRAGIPSALGINGWTILRTVVIALRLHRRSRPTVVAVIEDN
jgi:hypothetical protein